MNRGCFGHCYPPNIDLTCEVYISALFSQAKSATIADSGRNLCWTAHFLNQVGTQIIILFFFVYSCSKVVLSIFSIYDDMLIFLWFVFSLPPEFQSRFKKFKWQHKSVRLISATIADIFLPIFIKKDFLMRVKSKPESSIKSAVKGRMHFWNRKYNSKPIFRRFIGWFGFLD